MSRPSLCVAQNALHDKILSRNTCHQGASYTLRITLQQELDRLAKLIGTGPEGMGIDAIMRQRGPAYQRRTVQRRLAMLPATVPEAERAHFMQLVLAEFKALHAGNAVRFGMGALEWEG